MEGKDDNSDKEIAPFSVIYCTFLFIVWYGFNNCNNRLQLTLFPYMSCFKHHEMFRA